MNEVAILAVLLAILLDPFVLVPATLAGWFARSWTAVLLIPIIVIVFFATFFAAFGIVPFRAGTVILKIFIGMAVAGLVHIVRSPKK